MGKPSGTINKVSQPFLGKVLDRDRLYKKLDQARTSPVIWISGPPGAGKTCLTASYVKSFGVSCLWFQVDPGDADPATCFYFLGLAAKNAAPRSRKRLPLYTPEYALGLKVFSLRYFESLYAKLKPPSVLVFDNFQDAGTDNDFHTLIKQAASIVPQGINVLILSRTAPWGRFIDLLAKDIMVQITWEDLKLTWKETQDIAAFRTHGKIEKNTLRSIYNRIHGWAAGLTLMLETIKIYPDQDHGVCEESLEDIFDYFADEILDKTDPDFKEFLFKTALFPWIDLDTARAITENPLVSSLFSKLTRNQYFITRVYRPRVSYQFHPLFRAFLLSRAREYYPPETMEQLIEKSAQLLETMGEIEASAQGFSEIKNWKAVIRLITTHAPALLSQGRNTTVLRLLDPIPGPVFEKEPWLLFWKGAGLLPVDPVKSRRYFEIAFDQFRAQKDAAGILLSWAWFIEAEIIAFDNFKSFDQWIEKFEHFRDIYENFPVQEIRVQVAGSMFKALLMRRPWQPDLDSWAEKGLVSENDPEAVNRNIFIFFMLLQHYTTETGEIEKAGRLFQKLKKIEKKQARTPLSKILICFLQLNWYGTQGMFQKSVKVSARYKKISEYSGVKVMDFLMYGLEVSNALDLDDHDLAARLLRKMESFPQRMRSGEESLYYAQKARLALVKGEYDQAAIFGAMALEQMERVGQHFPTGICLLLYAQACHEVGKHDSCHEALSRLFRMVLIPGGLLEYLGLMVKSYVYFDTGDPISGRNTLEHALAVGREKTYFPVLADQPRVTAFLCSKALEYNIAVDYVRLLIQKKGLLPPAPFLYLETWPRMFHITTLGRFELKKNGVPVTFSRKPRQKPLAMLKAIIIHGGQGVHQDRISDSLWPDLDGDKAQQTFATTLHRLRKLLGSPGAVVLSNNRVSIDPRHFWVDIWAFNRVIQLRFLPDHEQGAQTSGTPVHRFEKAVNLYNGSFLAEEAWDPMILSLREDLRGKFVSSIITLACFWEDCGNFKRAAAWYEMGLERERHCEILYRKLIEACLASGKKDRAMAVLTRCQTILNAELGKDLSPETQAAAKGLKPSK